MPEKTHQGKTRSEWLRLQRRGGGFGEPSDAEIYKAVLWFEEDDRKERSEQIEHLKSGQTDLKRSVDRLANPHWVLWATLVATAIAAIAGVILLFR
jgi:hypothetical protein